MDKHIIDYISQFIKLSEDEEKIITEQNLFKRYKKNELLISEGEYAKDCYFIIQGCLRAYYIKDGEERNTDFFFENQTVTPISYITKQPSQYYLSCLEDCILAVGNEARNQKLIEQIPNLSILISQMNERILVEKTVEFDNFKNHSPEERYLLLLKNKSEFLTRIPLYHLATYLGITQISLSRIRNRISEKKQ
jgi:CRP-like cAMP-binding protein